MTLYRWSQHRNRQKFQLCGMCKQLARMSENPVLTSRERQDLEDARNRIYSVVENFKSRNVLSKMGFFAFLGEEVPRKTRGRRNAGTF